MRYTLTLAIFLTYLEMMTRRLYKMGKIKKLNFRITDELHRKLKIIAIKEGRTMNDIICSLIKQYVEQYEEGEDASK